MLFGALVLLCGCSCTSKSCSGRAGQYKPLYEKYANMPLEQRLDDARSRRGAYYSILLKRFINEAPGVEKGGTVFIGDSLIQGFPVDKSFKDPKVVNCGVSGDRILGVAERLDVCVKAFEPGRVYLMVGINDLLKKKSKPVGKLADAYHRLVKDMKYAAPNADITVFSILPVSGDFVGNNSRVYQLNDEIKSIAAKEGVEYFDLHPFFTAGSGDLNPRYTTEGLHLNLNGYLCWMQAFLDGEEFLDAAMNLSEIWTWKHSGSFKINKIDPPFDGEFPGSRGADELVIYTPKYEKPSTGTNEWGREAIVREGIVREEKVGDSPIPADGFVVSGHGVAASWISGNLKPGVHVEYNPNTVKFAAAFQSNMTAADRLDFLKTGLFEILASKRDTGISPESKKKALAILEKIHDMQSGKEEMSMKEIDKLSEEIKAME